MRAIVIAILMLLPSVLLADRMKVVVQPFSNDEQDAVARSVQSSMVADLSRAQGLSAEAGSAQVDSTKAIEQAKSRNARFLIVGAYQSVDGETRFTGQVMDLASGNIVGGLKATGVMRDLFGLEDELAVQAQRAIEMSLRPAPATQPAAPAVPPAPVAVAQQPQKTTSKIFEGSELDRALKGEPSVWAEYERARRNYYYGEDAYGYGSGYGYGYGAYYPGYWGYGWGLNVVVTRRIPRPFYQQPWPTYTYTGWR